LINQKNKMKIITNYDILKKFFGDENIAFANFTNGDGKIYFLGNVNYSSNKILIIQKDTEEEFKINFLDFLKGFTVVENK
jgi:hypothetical protein